MAQRKRRPSKLPKKRTLSRAKKHPASDQSISPKQLALKAGYRRDGRGMISLSDLLSTPESDTIPLSDLSEGDRADLTAERIRDQKKFRIGLVGLGVLDKKRAIAEVRQGTAAGRALVDIETRTLRAVIERARAARAGGTQ